jgi:hypothetical protein
MSTAKGKVGKMLDQKYDKFYYLRKFKSKGLLQKRMLAGFLVCSAW